MEGSSPSTSWEVFVSAAELEWIEVPQIPPDLSRAYLGRAGGMRVGWYRPARPAPVPFPRLCPQAVWWRALAL
eukprot:8835321-Pyramimonas_sp.AAC.1